MEKRVRIFGGLILTLMILTICRSGSADTRQWTAPGDDGNAGIATEYSIRWAFAADSLRNNWEACHELPNPPVPLVAGTLQSYLMPNDIPGDTIIFVAIKTADEVPNWSAISNIISVRTPDRIAPAAIVDFR